MVNISGSCDLPDIDAFITEMEGSTQQLAGLGPGIAVGVGADAVAAALTFVGLEAFILATELSGDSLLELLLELQRDPQLQQDIQAQVRTDTQRCINPVLPRLGLGSTDSSEIEETWNELGGMIEEALDDVNFMVSTPAINEAVFAWRRTFAQLTNCLEILVERNIICSTGETKERCRLPAIVMPCVLRANPEKPE